jgi:hypothetical protein
VGAISRLRQSWTTRSALVGFVVLAGLSAWPASASASWPVWPRNEQHPIRGGFADPRWDGRAREWRLHGGVDVAVDERTRETRKVYSLVTGRVSAVTVTPTRLCGGVTIGRVHLGHVSAARVRVGQHVQRGQVIARTCPTLWHVHVSERDLRGRQVNPLRRGGVLYPYEDTAPPVIGSIVPDSGGYQARIEDPDSFRGWFGEVPRLYEDHAPNLIQIDGRPVIYLRRIGKGTVAWHDSVYGDRAFRDLTAARCMSTTDPCQGEHWFRLGALAPGPHLFRVWDVAGNLTTATVSID